VSEFGWRFDILVSRRSGLVLLSITRVGDKDYPIGQLCLRRSSHRVAESRGNGDCRRNERKCL